MKPNSRRGRKSDAPSRIVAAVDNGILDELLGYHLRRAQAAVFNDFMRTMAEDQITPGQFGVLTLIDRNPDLNQSALARVLGIERSTMVAVIDRLEERRLVARHESVSDRRSNVLGLTARGKALLAAAKPKVRRHEKHIAAGLEPGEVTALVDFLRRISSAG